MVARFLRSALPALLFGALGSGLAQADIYTWVDRSGTINVSNLAPPEGAQVMSIIHASAPEAAARDAAARETARQAEVQALNERMRQLEGEIELASRQAPPADYRPILAPPVMQYVVNIASPPEQYPVDATPQAYAGCNPGWIGCGLWWAYPASVVVLNSPSARFHPIHGRQEFPPFGAQTPSHPPFVAPPPMFPPFVAPPPMFPPFAQPPMHPPFAAQQPMLTPFGPRKG
jgi:hypothetical protein